MHGPDILFSAIIRESGRAAARPRTRHLVAHIIRHVKAVFDSGWFSMGGNYRRRTLLFQPTKGRNRISEPHLFLPTRGRCSDERLEKPQRRRRPFWFTALAAAVTQRLQEAGTAAEIG